MTQNGLGSRIFRFAVIADTHVNPSDDTRNSPFAVNRKANRRFRHLVGDLNQRNLRFVVHLGDLVHPVPSRKEPYGQAADAFRQIASELTVPMHVLPGNHDVGDKPGAGGPMPSVSADGIQAWQTEFGPDHGVFDHDPLRIVFLNAQLINSGTEKETAQRDWLEGTLRGQPGRRTFLMLHHPPFLCWPDEAEHYDNLAEPGRGWLLDLVRECGVQAMFAAHAHNFWYDRVGVADYFRSPAICFVRQDYSEMQHAPPDADMSHGRDDRAKLGYLLVDVHEAGHAVRVIRTHGAERGEADAVATISHPAPPPRAVENSARGFDLRRNWAEVTEISPTGVVDEFDRKPARNDYHLLGLLEMGIKRLRIPLSDLRDPLRRKRLEGMKALGFRFTVFSLGAPSEGDLALVSDRAEVLEDWELALADPPDVWGDICARITGRARLGLYVSPVSPPAHGGGDVLRHVIAHGVDLEDEEMVAKISRLRPVGVEGAVFRRPCAGLAQADLTAIADAVRAKSMRASVHLRTGADDPGAESPSLETVIASVMMAGRFCARHPETRFFVDTLVEQDRGYFPRHGALTSTLNPTPLAQAIVRLHTELAEDATTNTGGSI